MAGGAATAMKRFIWELEVLTPVHIGSGEQWSTLDYVYDPTARLLRVIDLDRLLAHPRISSEDLARYCERHDLQIAQYLQDRRIAPATVERYSLPCPHDPQTRPVRCFVKTPFGNPYLPGSSLKGAIRTAVLWHLLQPKGAAFTKALDRVSRNDRSLPRSAYDRQWTGSEIERLPEAFSKEPNTDLMRVIQIEDSPQLPLESLEVIEVGSYLLNAQGRLERNRSLTSWVEALKPGTRIAMPLRCDDFLFSEMAQELGFASKRHLVEGRGLLDVLRSFTEPLLETEIQFYHRSGLAEVAKSLESLEAGDGVLLCVGWGGGWSAKTILRRFIGQADLDLMALRKIYRLGRSRSQGDFYHHVFPKSRRLALAGPSPRPLGWVRIRSREEG